MITRPHKRHQTRKLHKKLLMIQSNQQQVDKFVELAKPGDKKAFNYNGDGTVIGRSVQKGATTVEDVTKAKVVIKKKSDGGIVLTAYPRK